MSVHAFCLSSRRAVARLYSDGRVEYRTDPDWFTPYQRRETVEWNTDQDSAQGSSESATQSASEHEAASKSANDTLGSIPIRVSTETIR